MKKIIREFICLLFTISSKIPLEALIILKDSLYLGQRPSENSLKDLFGVFEEFGAPRLATNGIVLHKQKHVGNIVHTYFSIKTNLGWSAPVRLFSNSQQSHCFRITNRNHSYGSPAIPGATTGINICRLITTSADTDIESPGTPINTKNNETCFFTSADESNMLLIRASSTNACNFFIGYITFKCGWTNRKLAGEPISTPNPQLKLSPMRHVKSGSFKIIAAKTS